VLSHEIAVVRAKHYDGTLAEVKTLERVQDLPEPIVKKANHSVIRPNQTIEIIDRSIRNIQKARKDKISLRGSLELINP
jgi:hypothetical protein